MVNWDKVDKKNHIILIVPTKLLPNFQGFSKEDHLNIIKNNFGFLTRGNNSIFAESDTNYKQIIPYVVLFNPKTKKVYAYQRASNIRDSHEDRLHGNWSWGVGGHADFQEESFDNIEEFLKQGMKRELNEELSFNNGTIKEIKQLGFINDNSNNVGQVHFGIVFIAITNSTDISPNDSETVLGKFLSYEELEDIYKQPNVDNWSRIILKPIKEFIRNSSV